ncbi:hypothetical protein I4U23_004344 [Adineta vaga]|nr:hypothetical protein I4U23_004344 [Adineta vaga]
MRKRYYGNIRRWRQETSTAPIPLNINFPIIPDEFYRTTRDTLFLCIDTGPNSDRMLVFPTDEQRDIMENGTVAHVVVFINKRMLFSVLLQNCKGTTVAVTLSYGICETVEFRPTLAPSEADEPMFMDAGDDG